MNSPATKTSSSLVLLLIFGVSLCYGSYELDGSGRTAEDGGASGRSFQRPLAFYTHGPLPNERRLSNDLHDLFHFQAFTATSTIDVSEWSTYFGLFVFHDVSDMNLTSEADPIAAPLNDYYFDLDGDGSGFVPFYKSFSANDSVHAPVNMATAFLDLDPIYGKSAEVATALRTLEGGSLYMPDGVLPTAAQVTGVPLRNPRGRPASQLYVSGDARVNEHEATLLIHTLFALEHNRLAALEASARPHLSDEDLFQHARQANIHQYQQIVMGSFMRSILGEDMEAYEGYDEATSADTNLLLATVTFPALYSGLSGGLLYELPSGSATHSRVPVTRALRDFFYAPSQLSHEELGALALGLSDVRVAKIDTVFPEDLRSFAFGQPGRGGEDIFATTLRRTREVGVPPGSALRVSLGLAPYTSFADITSNTELAALLESSYGTVDRVEGYVAALCEDHPEGKRFGPLLTASWKHQMAAVRSADPHWFEALLSSEELEELKTETLSVMIKNNFPEIASEVKDFVMIPGEQIPPPVPPPLDSFSEADYTFTVQLLDGQYSLSWIEWGTEFIQFAFRAPTSGWVGIGFGAEQGMAGADLIIGTVVDGVVSVGDYFADKNGAPIPDEEDGGRNNNIASGGFEVSGSTTIIIRRPFIAAEPQDKALVNGDNRVCIAFGKDDELTRHSPQARGSVHIDFATGALSDVVSSHAGLIAAHSVMLGVAWVVVVPAALLVHRYGWFLTRTQRRTAHVALNGLATLMTVVAVVMISIVVGAAPPDGAHPIMALRILVLPLVLVQVALRVVPWVPAETVTKVHRGLGLVLYIIGQIEVDIGIARMGLHYAFTLFVLLWQIAVVVLAARMERLLWEYVGLPGISGYFRSYKVKPVTAKESSGNEGVEGKNGGYNVELASSPREVSESAMIEAERKRQEAEALEAARFGVKGAVVLINNK